MNHRDLEDVIIETLGLFVVVYTLCMLATSCGTVQHRPVPLCEDLVASGEDFGMECE